MQRGVPAEVVQSVKDRVLDILGVSLAALPLPTSAAAADHVRDQGGAPQAHAIGIKEMLPSSAAAFVNGVLAHSLDYDDTHLPSIVHPSASVIPASLAAAELAGAGGRTTISAIGVGLEICIRLGMAGYDAGTRTSIFFDRGQHATSICGTVASAGAAAALLGLDAEGIAHAIGIAVSMASGVIEGNRAGGTVKRIHCGLAAQAGVNAALLAQGGITGPPTALEGRFGFFQAFLGERHDAAAVTEGLGENWSVPDIFFKPYPCNHFTHSGIDAALSLRKKGLSPGDVEEVRLGVASATVRTIGEPIERKRAPETGYEAQFSGPYTVAAALVGGSGLGLGLSDFTDELARDPARRDLMARVIVEPNAECDSIYPLQFPAVLEVRTRDGAEMSERVLANRGGPDRPLRTEELETKFRENALRVLDEVGAESLKDIIARMETLDDIRDLFEPAGAADLTKGEKRG